MGPQPYGWRPGYDQHQVPPQPTPQPGYNPYPGAVQAPPFPIITPQPLPTSTTPVPVQSQPAQPGIYGAVPLQGSVQPQQQPQPQPPQSPVAAAAGFGVMPVGGYAGQQSSPPYSQQGPAPYPTQPQQATQLQTQPQSQAQAQQPYQQQPIQEPAQQSVQQHVQQYHVQQSDQQSVQQAQQLLQQSEHQPVQQPFQQPVQQPFQQVVQEPFQQPSQQLVQQSVQHPNQHSPQGLGQQQLQLQPAQTETIAQPQVQAVPESTSASSQPQFAQELGSPHPQSEPHAQIQSQHPAQPISGLPPYPYDPSYTYADQNAQAWAQYYAQGGTDLAGSVYFISIPGVKEGSVASTLQHQQPQQTQQGGQLPSQSSYPNQRRESQDLSRNSSYQAQVQPQPQGFSPQSYPQGQVQGANEASTVGPATASMVHQAHAKMPRYQLSDNPVPGSAPTQSQGVYGSQHVGPTRADSGDNKSSEHVPSSPTTLSTTAPLKIKRAQSPAQASTTPSWVLPKKTNNAPGIGGGFQGNSGSPPPGGSYYQTVGSS